MSSKRMAKADGAFEQKLRTLLEVGNLLSMTGSVDALCRRIIELGRDRLKFDRMSIWFIDSDPEFINGSFGVDEMGEMRFEKGERVRINEDAVVSELRRIGGPSIVCHEVPMRDHRGNIVGVGTHAIASIWNGEEVVGYLSTDNLLNHKPILEEERELLELYASTFGHLYSLKKTEEALRSAYLRLKEIQEQLAEAMKLGIGGEVASGVVHEVKNPLSVIARGIEYLSERFTKADPAVQSVLESIRDATSRASITVMGLLDHSRLSRLNLADYDMREITSSALSLVSHQIEKYHIIVAKDFMASSHVVKIDKNKVEQVIVNILLNAVYSMADGGTLSIRTLLDSRDPSSTYLSVVIEDTGTGISKDALAKIFDPFFTTRATSGGTGMGLSVVKEIMTLHKGMVMIENREDCCGVRVALLFRA